MMVYVRVKDDEPFEKALRKFKNKWIKLGRNLGRNFELNI